MKPEAAEGPADETPADPIAPSDDATRLRWKPGQPSPRWWAFLGLLLLGAAGWWLFQGTARNPLDRLPDLPRNTTDQDVASFIEAARAVVTANPRDDDAWGQLGMAYAAHQMAAEAVTCWEIATELAPRKFAWRYLLGDAFVQFDPLDAIRQFESATQLEPENPYARYRLAELYLELQRGKDAERHLNQIAMQQPDDPRLNLLKARLAYQRGEFDKSMRLADRTVQSAPQSRSAHEMAVLVLNRLGRIDDIRQHMQILSQLPPRPTPWPDPYLDEIAALRQDDHDFAERLAQLTSSNQSQEGLQQLEQNAVEHPEDAMAQIALVRTLLQLGQQDQADAALTSAIRRHPSSAELHRLRGQAFLQRGDRDAAVMELRKAILIKPDNLPAWMDLGHTLLELQRPDEAILAFEQATRIQPSQVAAHHALGELLLQRGDAEAAAQHVRAALQLTPEDPALLELMRKCDRAANM